MPGYVGHTAERLRVTVGEVSDFAEARGGEHGHRPGAAAAASALLSPGEARGEVKSEGDLGVSRPEEVASPQQRPK